MYIKVHKRPHSFLNDSVHLSRPNQQSHVSGEITTGPSPEAVSQL